MRPCFIFHYSLDPVLFSDTQWWLRDDTHLSDASVLKRGYVVLRASPESGMHAATLGAV